MTEAASTPSPDSLSAAPVPATAPAPAPASDVAPAPAPTPAPTPAPLPKAALEAAPTLLGPRSAESSIMTAIGAFAAGDLLTGVAANIIYCFILPRGTVHGSFWLSLVVVILLTALATVIFATSLAVRRVSLPEGRLLLRGWPALLLGCIHMLAAVFLGDRAPIAVIPLLIFSPMVAPIFILKR